MDPKQQPLYLDRDGLSNALVNLKIKTQYNQTHLINKILEHADKVKTSEPLQRLVRTQKHPETKELKEIYFLANSVYRVLINDDDISFNFVRGYPLWKNYMPFILSCLSILDGDIQISEISMRYISGFDNTSIFNQLDGEIKLNYLPIFDGSEFTFRYAVNDIIDGIRFQGFAIIKLTDSFVSPKGTTSIVDITVVGQNQNNVEALLSFLHKHERELFFRIFKKNFIDTLGAHYE